MLNKQQGLIDWVKIQGSFYEIGLELGKKGKQAVHENLLKSALWQIVTDDKHQKHLERLKQNTKAIFPEIWQEIEGLADGLELPIDKVFAWNCRGDLLATIPDGCSTVQLPGDVTIIAHNEDGLPFFQGHCFIAEIQGENQPGFWTFCYPGSIPGHTFGVSQAGLIMTVNNLRLHEVEASFPRMVVGRAVIQSKNLDDALNIIDKTSNSGGFHFTLCELESKKMLSIEFGGGKKHINYLSAPDFHTNHALRLDFHQTITESSRDRQVRGEFLLDQGERDPLKILQDKQKDGLPIYRDAPNDPDCENTLATVIFTIEHSNLHWVIHDRRNKEPLFTCTTT